MLFKELPDLLQGNLRDLKAFLQLYKQNIFLYSICQDPLIQELIKLLIKKYTDIDYKVPFLS